MRSKGEAGVIFIEIKVFVILASIVVAPREPIVWKIHSIGLRTSNLRGPKGLPGIRSCKIPRSPRVLGSLG